MVSTLVDYRWRNSGMQSCTIVVLYIDGFLLYCRPTRNDWPLSLFPGTIFQPRWKFSGNSIS
jgi:hypothetical protein